MGITVSPQKLLEHVDTGFRKLKPFRDHRESAMREFVGRWYGQGDGKTRPLNLVNHAVSVLVPNLAANKLGYKVRPHRVSMTMESEVLTVAMSEYARETRLVNTIRRCVMDAIMGPLGIVKCGLRAGNELVKIQDRLVNRGEFYVRRVDLDDWAIDPAARCAEEAFWECNRYRVSRQQALEAEIFPAHIIERLPSIQQQAYSDSQDGSDGVEQLSQDGGGGLLDRFDLIDMIELIDVALYEFDGKCYTVTIPARTGFANEYLAMSEHQGPEQGPYEHIWFQDVPNNVMPVPMVSVWRDLAESLNAVATKGMKNAATSKTVFAYSRSAQDDAETIRQARDFECVAVDDVEAMEAIEIGGLHPAHLQFMAMGMEWWNLASGNITMLGGTQQGQTDTATEFQGLQANLSVRIKDMIDAADDFRRRVGEHLLWEITTDPLIRRPFAMRIPGGELFEVHYDADARQGAHADYQLKVEPTVPMNMDPQVRARRLVEIMKMIPEWAAAEVASQGRVSFTKMLHAAAREFDFEVLEEISQDPMVLMANEQLWAGIEPQQGQVVGQWQGNRDATNERFNMGPRAPGQQNTPAAAAQSAGSMRVPAA